jgi:hypothetical protein
MAMFDDLDAWARRGTYGFTCPAAPDHRQTGAGSVSSAPTKALRSTRLRGRIDLDDPLTRLHAETRRQFPQTRRPSGWSEFLNVATDLL